MWLRLLDRHQSQLPRSFDCYTVPQHYLAPGAPNDLSLWFRFGWTLVGTTIICYVDRSVRACAVKLEPRELSW